MFKKSGQHILIGGITGSGKTQTLYYILDCLLSYHPQEKIIWFDTGKSAEILRLAMFEPIKIFIPNDEKLERTIRIEPRADKGIMINHDLFYYDKVWEIFDNISENKINVVSLEPFYQDDQKGYAKGLDDFFKILFKRAMNYSLNPPLAIFIDEVHQVAPSHGNALNEEHMQAGVRFQRNIERLRSAGVRIVGTIQDWTKLRRGVRTAFSWIIIKRGMTFTEKDLPQLARYNEKFWQLNPEDSIWVYPGRNFHDNHIQLPNYHDGKILGRVYYNEEIKKSLPLASHLSSKMELPIVPVPSSRTVQASPD